MTQPNVLTAVKEQHDRLRGRLFQAIEAAGLPATQESALKGLVRAASYDAQASLENIVREGVD